MNKHIATLLFLFLVYIISPASSGISIQNSKPSKVTVEVKGAVINPNVYTLDYNSNINDLLTLAIPLETADLSTINLTQVLKNHDVIVIANKQETVLISINSANINQLTKLPGIGETIASRIVEYRNRYGSFKKIEDIKKVKGIGEKLFDKIKDLICL